MVWHLCLSVGSSRRACRFRWLVIAHHASVQIQPSLVRHTQSCTRTSIIISRFIDKNEINGVTVRSVLRQNCIVRGDKQGVSLVQGLKILILHCFMHHVGRKVIIFRVTWPGNFSRHGTIFERHAWIVRRCRVKTGNDLLRRLCVWILI